MFDTGLLVHLSIVVAVIGAAVTATLAFRRRDRDRFATSMRRLALTEVDEPTESAIWEHVESAFDGSGTMDIAGVVGMSSVLTRKRYSAALTPTSMHVNDAVVAGRRSGVAAVISARMNSTTTGALSHRSSTTWRDVVVARLPRSIEGSIRGTVHAPVGFDIQRMRGFADRLNAAGMRTELLTDPDIGRAFIPDRPADDLVDGDEWLRALLWAIRPAAGAGTPNAATQRYESMIPSHHVLDLDGVAIADDLIVLSMSATPWRAGVRQDLVDLAEHLVTWFR